MKKVKPSPVLRNLSGPADESHVMVIGVGNSLRGDDAAGRIIAARVNRRAMPFINVVECSGEGADLMELWAGRGTVIVVDAVSSGAKVGTAHRFEATQAALPVQFSGSSTHAFGLGAAVELARILHKLPKCLIVFGIEGRRFDVGSRISAEVRRAIPSVVARVLEEAASASEGQLASSHFPVMKITDAKTPTPDTRG